MTTPMSVLEALARRGDRVTSARALVAMAPAMAPHVRDEDRQRMVRSLERAAGRKPARTATRPADVARTIAGLGLSLDGR